MTHIFRHTFWVDLLIFQSGGAFLISAEEKYVKAWNIKKIPIYGLWECNIALGHALCIFWFILSRSFIVITFILCPWERHQKCATSCV